MKKFHSRYEHSIHDMNIPFLTFEPTAKIHEVLEQWRTYGNKYYGQHDETVKTLEVLNHNINYWKSKPFTQIDNLKGIINYSNSSNGREKSLSSLYRTIYECMEHSTENLNKLKEYQKLVNSRKLLAILGPGLYEHPLNKQFNLPTEQLCDFLCDLDIIKPFTLAGSYLDLDSKDLHNIKNRLMFNKLLSLIITDSNINHLCNGFINRDIHVTLSISMQQILISQQAEFFITSLQEHKTIPDSLKIAMYVIMLHIERYLPETIYATLDVYPIKNLRTILEENFKLHYPEKHNKYTILQSIDNISKRDIIFTLNANSIPLVAYPEMLSD